MATQEFDWRLFLRDYAANMMFLPPAVVANELGWYGPFSSVQLVVINALVLWTPTRPVQLLISGGDLRKRAMWRLLLQAVPVTAISYAVGWGPAFLLGLLATIGMHMRWSGARIWRPAMPMVLLLGAAGQTAVALDWVPDYIGSPQSYVVFTLTLLLTLSTLAQLGVAMEQREASETALRTSQEAAENSEAWFRALVHSISDMVLVVDANSRIKYVSPSVERQLGFHHDDLIEQFPDYTLDPLDRPVYEEFSLAVEHSDGEEQWSEMRLRHADGTSRWYQVSARNLLNDPHIRGVVVNYRDVHERRAYHDLLAFDASHDALTKLANRPALVRVLDEALVTRSAAVAATGVQADTVAVLFVDLDGFKPVNDQYGHEGGDALLVAVGQLLERCVLGADTVARIGGDEFAVVLTGIHRESDAVAVAERILHALSTPLRIPRADVRVGASIGVALAVDSSTATELLRQADHAMYRAKREGRNRYTVHDSGSDRELPDRVDHAADADALAHDLRHALNTGSGLALAYQPIVLLDDRSLWGVEALLRWRHPSRGPISPGEFIPLAERSDLIHDLGRWVLHQACRQVAAWHRQLPSERPLALSVNLSARELDQPELVDTVLRTVSSAGLDPELLVLEVTESALVDPEIALPALHALSRAGIRIAIDDFGTGYSSLQYLNQMPVDILKLDRSFVDRLDGTPEHAAIAEAVIRISETLRLGSVAEGVETEEQARELTLLGYRRAQGYLFGRPLTPEEVERLLVAVTAPNL